MQTGKMRLTARTATRACRATKAIFLQGMAANVAVRSKRLSFGAKKGLPQKESPQKTAYVCKNTVHLPQRVRRVTPLRPTKSPKGAPCRSKTHNSADRKTTSVCFCRQSAAKSFCSAANANTVFARYRKTFCRNIFSKIFVTQRASNKNPCGAAKNGRYCCFALCAKKGSAKRSPFERSTSHKNNSKKQYTSTAAGKKATLPPTKATSRFVLL